MCKIQRRDALTTTAVISLRERVNLGGGVGNFGGINFYLSAPESESAEYRLSAHSMRADLQLDSSTSLPKLRDALRNWRRIVETSNGLNWRAWLVDSKENKIGRTHHLAPDRMPPVRLHVAQSALACATGVMTRCGNDFARDHFDVAATRPRRNARYEAADLHNVRRE